MLTGNRSGSHMDPRHSGGSMAFRGTRQTLGDEERKVVKSLLQSLEPFNEIRGTMPLQYIRAFLLVCEEEGLAISEYARRSGVSLSVMSRHMRDIGDIDRYQEEGMGLVTTRQDPLDRRNTQALLTDKGRVLMHRIRRAWS